MLIINLDGGGEKEERGGLSERARKGCEEIRAEDQGGIRRRGRGEREEKEKLESVKMRTRRNQACPSHSFSVAERMSHKDETLVFLSIDLSSPRVQFSPANIIIISSLIAPASRFPPRLERERDTKLDRGRLRRNLIINCKEGGGEGGIRFDRKIQKVVENF